MSGSEFSRQWNDMVTLDIQKEVYVKLSISLEARNGRILGVLGVSRRAII